MERFPATQGRGTTLPNRNLNRVALPVKAETNLIDKIFKREYY
jgi:hypothetical protein